ncbi:MAG: IS66 family transposase [Nanoarchaeota archaeon]|nr:IS66 family transposase [Nanoarchaeota archaeon]
MGWQKGKNNPLRKMIYANIKDNLKDKSKDDIIDEFIELLKEKHKLEKELKKYKNSNTPSSSNKHLKENTQGLKTKKGAKRGAPKGHKGNTLQLTPDKIINLIARLCGKCKSSNIKPTGYIKKRIVICYQKAKIIVKQYNQQEVLCYGCGELSLANHKDIPEKGIYDSYIQALVNYYKFKARLPHNLVVDVMNNVHDVPMTEPTSLEITRRASKKLEPLYQGLEREIKQAEVIHGDETSHSVMGVNHWIWVFCNSLISLFKFKKERGGDIVEKTLGKDFKGKLVSDGWGTYKTYARDNKILHQRCWDHLKREIKFECKKKHPDLYKWCNDIYSMVRKGKNYKQGKRKLDMHEKCKGELVMLITHMNKHRNLRKLATKIENGEDKWFTCILHPELPMDNNEAERSLRPFVIMRKIIGCLRSNLGMKNYEIMMSLISTWQKQGKNAFYSLQASL